MAKKKTDKPPNNGTPHIPEAPADRGRPVKRIYYSVFEGTLSVSIWDKLIQVEGGERTLYSASLQRSYEEDGERKGTHSLRDSDLPVAVMALQDAYRFINDLKRPLQQPPLATDEANPL